MTERCEACGRKLIDPASQRLGFGPVDHYLPEALGGTNERPNLRWCCWDCNQAKKDMHPREWERVRHALRPWVETAADTRTRILQRIARLARGVSA